MSIKKKLGAVLASFAMVVGVLLATSSTAVAAPERPLPQANVVCGYVETPAASRNCSTGSAGQIRHVVNYTYYKTTVVGPPNNPVTTSAFVTETRYGPWVGNGSLSQVPKQDSTASFSNGRWQHNGVCASPCAV